MKKASLAVAGAFLLALAATLYAQEAAVWERGLSIIRGSLTISTGNVVMGSGQIRSGPTQHLLLNSVAAGRAVRLNVRTSTVDTSGDFIGFRAAPRAGVASTGSVFGGQVSGQAGAFAVDGAVVGLQADVFLNGATGNVGHARGLQVEMVTSDAATRTIANDVAGIRFRTAWSGTITGDHVALLVERPETQTNSNDYTHFAKLTSTSAAWGSTGAPSVTNGWIKLEVNGADRYIQLYSTAP